MSKHAARREPAAPARLASEGFPYLRGALAAFLSVVFGLVAVSTVPALLHWRTTVVMSGSMEPRIRPGDVVAAAPVAADALRPGEVVLVRDRSRDDHLLLHRMVGRTSDGSIITRGDANAQEDSTHVAPADVVGLPRLRIPLVGLPAMWVRDGHPVRAGGTLGALAAALLVVLTAPRVEGRHRRAEVRTPVPVASLQDMLAS
ncbi:signal peptidase [Motilibacter rhizosphaerae]|uniref:Signal peptidase I n=1 Tax=Motilibacter rhizosphaerae TaxID=598652 RepID=A0A4Q7NBA0_9ACTN|nr:signal peptidase I [Motilibacter rhizosphaerae]RZS79449.1 signal peptidase [Motilibacter rhizosphaerae]